MNSGLAASRRPGMTAEVALVLEHRDRGVEDVAGLLVALTLHLLHPFVPERLARDLAPALHLVSRYFVAVDLVVAGLGAFERALLGGVEEVLAPEARADDAADAHDLVAHV